MHRPKISSNVICSIFGDKYKYHFSKFKTLIFSPHPIAQALGCGDEPRHSSHDSAKYREHNEGLIFLQQIYKFMLQAFSLTPPSTYKKQHLTPCKILVPTQPAFPLVQLISGSKIVPHSLYLDNFPRPKLEQEAERPEKITKSSLQ